MKLATVGDEHLARQQIAQKLKAIIPRPCQRILLIHPQHIPESDFRIERAVEGRRYWSYQPYGCGVVCRDLEDRGYNTDILDLNFDMLDQAHKLKENFKYNMWRDWLIKKLTEFKPDIVGISCMFTMSHDIVKNIAHAIKEYSSILPVLGGGVHLSNARKNALKDCPELDFIGVYESDRSFPDLVDFINGKKSEECLTQITTVIDDNYIAIEARSTPGPKEIEAAPIYHSLPVDRYSSLGQLGTYGFIWRREERKAASVLSNRGCRAHCSFCSVATFNGPGVRERSIESVLDEIQELRERYDIRHITWLDDDLLFDPKRALALFNGITNRKLGITWDASNGLIAAFINEDNMQAMAESGCIGFNLGIESGNPEILRHVHKPGTVDGFRKSKKIIAKYPHIFVKSFLIVGFPNETVSQLLDTFNLSVELDLDWHSLQILNPLPSTEMWDEMIALGLAQDKLETSDVAYVFGPHGKQRAREQEEKTKATEFYDIFQVADRSLIPDKDQIKDVWFLFDYRLNYERILTITDPIQLKKRSLQLEDICNRIAPDSAIAQLFSGVAEQKLGNINESQRRAKLSKEIVTSSAYWQKRFDAFDLNKLCDSLL